MERQAGSTVPSENPKVCAVAGTAAASKRAARILTERIAIAPGAAVQPAADGRKCSDLWLPTAKAAHVPSRAQCFRRGRRRRAARRPVGCRSEEHTSELQSPCNL